MGNGPKPCGPIPVLVTRGYQEDELKWQDHLDTERFELKEIIYVGQNILRDEQNSLKDICLLYF